MYIKVYLWSYVCDFPELKIFGYRKNVMFIVYLNCVKVLRPKESTLLLRVNTLVSVPQRNVILSVTIVAESVSITYTMSHSQRPYFTFVFSSVFSHGCLILVAL